jgi:hypothetical protein
MPFFHRAPAPRIPRPIAWGKEYTLRWEFSQTALQISVREARRPRYSFDDYPPGPRLPISSATLGSPPPLSNPLAKRSEKVAETTVECHDLCAKRVIIPRPFLAEISRDYFACPEVQEFVLALKLAFRSISSPILPI